MPGTAERLASLIFITPQWRFRDFYSHLEVEELSISLPLWQIHARCLVAKSCPALLRPHGV